jgi:predicted DNA-binding transcriptional regulator AlpA
MPHIPDEQRAEAYYLGSDVADRSSQKKRPTTPHERQGDRGSDDDAAPRQTVESARDLNFRDRLLTPKEAAIFLRVSNSMLAKARMQGDGPPYVKIGRSVRYAESALAQWVKSRMRLSTSQR